MFLYFYQYLFVLGSHSILFHPKPAWMDIIDDSIQKEDFSTVLFTPVFHIYEACTCVVRRRLSPCRGDEARPLQLHTLHQQPRLKGADLYVARKHSYDVRRLVL